MHNPKSIPVPVIANARPRDWRGYLVPFFQYIPDSFFNDGKVDFRVKDPYHVLQAVQNRLCGICGHHIHSPSLFSFIGGPDEIEQKVFSDPAMHGACAAYAMKACPFLALPDYKPAGRPIEGTVDDPMRATFRPARVGIMKAKGYNVVRIRMGESGPVSQTPACQPFDIVEVKWF